jgi:hypothetical protein
MLKGRFADLLGEHSGRIVKARQVHGLTHNATSG